MSFGLTAPRGNERRIFLIVRLVSLELQTARKLQMVRKLPEGTTHKLRCAEKNNNQRARRVPLPNLK